MKIFIVGLPSSGRTTVSKKLSEELGLVYIDSNSWIKSTFRDQEFREHEEQYVDSYNEYVSARLKIDPDLCSRNIADLIKINPIVSGSEDDVFIIDGLINPRDFVKLFDYNEDIVIFLNRLDNGQMQHKNEHNIAISVMKDYCSWAASSKFLDKKRWLECNFSIPGDVDNKTIKKLGSYNTILLIKSLANVISYLKTYLE